MPKNRKADWTNERKSSGWGGGGRVSRSNGVGRIKIISHPPTSSSVWRNTAAAARRKKKKKRRRSSRRMAAVGNNINSYTCLSSALTCPSQNQNEGLFLLMVRKKATCCSISGISSSCFMSSKINSFRRSGIKCELRESGYGCGVEKRPITGDVSSSSWNRMEEYNTAMKRMMRNPYEYHHDLGMNYTLIADNLIVGSQPQKPEDVDHLKHEENVAYILNLQQDKDVEYWGIDLQSIIQRCRQIGIRHMRRPAKDFDPDSLRIMLPKTVSSLEWAISEGKGRVYVHCTAGLGRAPAVAIAYMFWFGSMNLNTAYDTLTSKRPCGPNKRSIRGATYDLAKNDPWKEPFESLPEYAFEDVADWERNLIQDRVRSLRGT